MLCALTPDQTSFDMKWMVGLEVKVVVCVGGLAVDSDVQTDILLPLEKGVRE